MASGPVYPISPTGLNPNGGAGSSQPVIISATDWNHAPANYVEWNDSTITFVRNGKMLFSIMNNGRIAKGEAFTTTDEMSLAFWDKVAENFPVAWWKSLIKDQRPK